MELGRLVRNCLKWTREYSSRTNTSTIFAVASGQGKCGVTVVRISGPRAGTTLKRMTEMETLPEPRYAFLKDIKDPRNGEVIDRGLVLWFPGPNSFTGEDTCEFQIHGGLAVISAVLNSLSSLQNVRLSEAGEFTRRAFYNAKLDLTEVEGIADLLAAETEIQRKQAFFQTRGCLSKLYSEWKNELMLCLANVEAHIDFEETETMDGHTMEHITNTIQILRDNIGRHLKDGRKGERLRNGVRTVILGEPNVGKSSLLNVLCQRPAAIVTPLEGTTRDLLEIALNINGYPVILMDTAGLRAQTTDIIEKEGINRAFGAYREADLIFLVIDCAKYLTWSQNNPGRTFAHFLHEHSRELNLTSSQNDSDTSYCQSRIVILNKIDLISDTELCVFKNLEANIVSCESQEGIPLLLKEVTSKLGLLCGEPSREHPSMTQARHRHCLTKCAKHLDNFVNRGKGNDAVLMAEEMRKAVRLLGKLTGAVASEQLLDVIFKEFCIGK